MHSVIITITLRSASDLFVLQAEHLQAIIDLCHAEVKSTGSPHVRIGSVITKFTKDAIVKVNPAVISSYARWVSELGITDYPMEYLDWYGRNVDPTELACSPAWLEECARTITKAFPLTLLTTTMVHMCGENRQINMRPTQDTARFITVAEMTALKANKDALDLIEAFLVQSRAQLEPAIAKAVGARSARDLLYHLETQAVRMAYAKSLHKEFPTKVSGKMSAEKLDQMRTSFLFWLTSHGSALESAVAELGVAFGDECKGSEPTEVICDLFQPLARPKPHHAQMRAAIKSSNVCWRWQPMGPIVCVCVGTI